MDLYDVLGRLRGVHKEGHQYKAECPAHNDGSPSLAVRAQGDRVVLYCHAGCSYRSIIDALAIKPGELGDSQAYMRKLLPGVVEPVLPNLDFYMENMNTALPLAAAYLQERQIPLVVAEMFGVGFAPYGCWPHFWKRDKTEKLCRQVRPGRVVFPHHTLSGKVVNLYGRAAANVDREQRHDHLPGNRGIFNAPAIKAAMDTGLPLWICEGPFDALAAICAGAPHAIAIFGLKGWRMDWLTGIRSAILAFDNDDPGRTSAKEVIGQLDPIVPQVSILPAEAYGGAKDLNEAWISGALSSYCACAPTLQ